MRIHLCDSVLLSDMHHLLIIALTKWKKNIEINQCRVQNWKLVADIIQKLKILNYREQFVVMNRKVVEKQIHLIQIFTYPPGLLPNLYIKHWPIVS